MDITDDLDRGREFEEGGLGEENFPGQVADGDDLGGLEAQVLANFTTVPGFEKALDNVVDIDGRTLTPTTLPPIQWDEEGAGVTS